LNAIKRTTKRTEKAQKREQERHGKTNETGVAVSTEKMYLAAAAGGLKREPGSLKRTQKKEKSHRENLSYSGKDYIWNYRSQKKTKKR